MAAYNHRRLPSDPIPPRIRKKRVRPVVKCALARASQGASCSYDFSAASSLRTRRHASLRRDRAPPGRPPVAAFQAAATAELPVASPPRYEYRAAHDPNGTGKFYMGREIAQVMGPGGLAGLIGRNAKARNVRNWCWTPWTSARVTWLPTWARDQATSPSAWRTAWASAARFWRLTSRMRCSATIRQRAAAQGVTNVEEIKSTPTDPRLPADSVDAVLMVDVYHELAYPFEVMTAVRAALKPGGRVVFVEYRKEDPSIPIKEVHKMSVDQLTKEMDAVGPGARADRGIAAVTAHRHLSEASG